MYITLEDVFISGGDCYYFWYPIALVFKVEQIPCIPLLGYVAFYNHKEQR